MIDPTQIPKPLIDLAKETASKPVASFSEFISLKLFGKTNAKLRAEAENEYEKVKHQGEIERNAREPFMIQLETAKAHRQYTNLGNALVKAKPLITADKANVKDDNDVFWGLLEHAKDISNEKMQDLIAKIIAGEYNEPGTYAMSTLQIIKMLGKSELELFEKIASLMVDNDRIPKELFTLGENEKVVMNNLSLDFGSLQALQSLGLILPNDMTRSIPNPDKKILQVRYYEKELIFEAENENYKEIRLPGFYGPSTVGKQILPHLNPKYNETFYQWLKEHYKVPNYKLKI